MFTRFLPKEGRGAGGGREPCRFSLDPTTLREPTNRDGEIDKGGHGVFVHKTNTVIHCFNPSETRI